MFDELKKYKQNGSFFFKANDLLREVCDAPKDKSGVYMIFGSDKHKDNPIYIGSSGKIQKDGKIKHRKGGLYDRISGGKQFNESRKISWPIKMNEQQIDELSIYWYVTLNNEVADIPSYVEALLMQQYFKRFKRLPDWNEEF